MRLFISTEIPKEIKDELFKIQKEITGQTAKIKWVSKKNLHITLKFIGDVDEPGLQKLKTNLRNISFEPFELSLDKLGFFLLKGEPNILRLTFKDTKELVSLQRKIDSELLNDFPSLQKFSPHLTIGRIKSIKNEKELLKKISMFKFTRDPFLVNSFSLMESRLTKDGPNYFILDSFKA